MLPRAGTINRPLSILSDMFLPVARRHLAMDSFLTELLSQAEQRGTAFIPCSTGLGRPHLGELGCGRVLLITLCPLYGRRDRYLRRVIDGPSASLEADRTAMRITLVGARHSGVTTLNMLRQHAVEIAHVVVAHAEDRPPAAAPPPRIRVRVQAHPKHLGAS